jgi:hypothetical protein
MNKRNGSKSLILIALASTSLLLLGLTYSSEPPSERVEVRLPLFGHFYPNAGTNGFSIPNSRYGSGIR